jgi:tRNA dimethylallyltransferase
MSSIDASGVVRLRVICGPTGAGKSALALRLAAGRGGAILSADSRQIYRGFDIGTAKPSSAERATVPHFGIDLVDPLARYSAAEWAAAVPEWLAACRAVGRQPVIVGGTGFYLRALFSPLFEAPRVDLSRRGALAGYLHAFDTGALRRWCRMLDPRRAHLGRAQLLRAVETALLTGQRISDLHVIRSRAPRYTARYLLMDPGRALAGTIAERTDRMLAAGWLDEVRALVARIPPEAPSWTATGYDALRDVVAGVRTLQQARESIVMRTHRYAKRQRTWFRHQLEASWTTLLEAHDEVALARASAWWDEGAA